LSAFEGRGHGDHLGSRDVEDIILLIDGREELVYEVAAATADLRTFVAGRISRLLDQPRFIDAIFSFLRADMTSQARAASVVLPRLRALAEQ
jgi:hypothetical protein